MRHNRPDETGGMHDRGSNEARRHRAVARDDLPSAIEITAWTGDQLIMAMRHREHPVEGVQFHPESIGTPLGRDILRNFLSAARVPTMAGAVR